MFAGSTSNGPPEIRYIPHKATLILQMGFARARISCSGYKSPRGCPAETRGLTGGPGSVQPPRYPAVGQANGCRRTERRRDSGLVLNETYGSGCYTFLCRTRALGGLGPPPRQHRLPRPPAWPWRGRPRCCWRRRPWPPSQPALAFRHQRRRASRNKRAPPEWWTRCVLGAARAGWKSSGVARARGAATSSVSGAGTLHEQQTFPEKTAPCRLLAFVCRGPRSAAGDRPWGRSAPGRASAGADAALQASGCVRPLQSLCPPPGHRFRPDLSTAAQPAALTFFPGTGLCLPHTIPQGRRRARLFQVYRLGGSGCVQRPAIPPLVQVRAEVPCPFAAAG